jgi:hypothetical protein
MCFNFQFFYLFEVIFFFALMQKRNKKNQGCEKKAKN